MSTSSDPSLSEHKTKTLRIQECQSLRRLRSEESKKQRGSSPSSSKSSVGTPSPRRLPRSLFLEISCRHAAHHTRAHSDRRKHTLRLRRLRLLRSRHENIEMRWKHFNDMHNIEIIRINRRWNRSRNMRSSSGSSLIFMFLVGGGAPTRCSILLRGRC